MTKDIKDIILHLRFPFSILLMPVFLLAYSQTEPKNNTSAFLIFVILHLIVYPSSNGYNSLQDNDKGSIGGIKEPPKVPSSMLYVTWALDVISIFATWYFFSSTVLILLVSYIIASRLYSYRPIRIKQYAIMGFLLVTIFQGPVIFAISKLAMGGSLSFSIEEVILLMISYLLIGAGYPLSQIYQFEQDREDGVHTMSMLLGIKGTFIFSGILFAVQGILMFYRLVMVNKDMISFCFFIVCMAPVFIHFNKWMLKTFKDSQHADFDHTMKMNKLGAIAINIFFILLTIKSFSN